MNARSMLPLIDLGFLTLGAVVALLAQSSPQRVEMIPVDLAAASEGASDLIDAGEPVVVTVTPEGMFVGDKEVDLASVVAEVDGRDVLLQPDRGADAQALVGTLTLLTASGVDVRLAVTTPEGADR